MFSGLTGWHALILLVIILLLFGAPKLPALARSLGQSMKIFRSEVKDGRADDAVAEDAGETPPASKK
jgi:sec-independent protein translocase protein TatA